MKTPKVCCLTLAGVSLNDRSLDGDGTIYNECK